jgi:hypothetical protein
MYPDDGPPPLTSLMNVTIHPGVTVSRWSFKVKRIYTNLQLYTRRRYTQGWNMQGNALSFDVEFDGICYRCWYLALTLDPQSVQDILLQTDLLIGEELRAYYTPSWVLNRNTFMRLTVFISAKQSEMRKWKDQWRICANWVAIRGVAKAPAPNHQMSLTTRSLVLKQLRAVCSLDGAHLGFRVDFETCDVSDSLDVLSINLRSPCLPVLAWDLTWIACPKLLIKYDMANMGNGKAGAW